ncbi:MULTISPECIES: bifunctional RNase H/acid phosphatase [Streptomyces]|uniref:Bifunctional RNase H/acid phosphatase n=1 Tax=Streptomyces doudnae TaxID=3075536 RepID=A0ABD5ENY1_9ACTN|nr:MULTISPECIES: bifunctional RNase H/acid phosphatase [unclassified Streptomyces]MDT0435097.1 bifunctional RNase H/acid phosphatase [Streptomyces sp. DSM 41981]MYQ68229.1 bifunctional RNase H/acid phosphatase [Streptomyces sp. SID4950]SCE44271.1 probable phosphoglycerate mutase [Streptomyces sp. SolWspMP-5a-2]
MREFIVEADGGSRGNPGPAGYGAVVIDAVTGETAAEASESIGVATNNVAEYRGLLAGLRAAHALDPAATVHVRMDSKLVVEQMSGRWKIKHPDMKPLALAASRVFPPDRVTFEWIPRERNKHADRLANRAMDAAASADAPSAEGTEVGAAEAGTTAGAAKAGTAATASSSSSSSASSVAPAAEREAAGAGAGAGAADDGGTGAAADRRAARVVAAPGWAPADMGAPATLVLLRHGETPLTPQKRFSGSGGSDPSLSDTGREQARLAGEALARRGTVQAIVASPLARTRETAGIVAARLGLDVRIEDGLRETDFGAWEGLTFGEVRDRHRADLDAWLADPSVAPTGGGESFETTAARVAAARDRLIAAYAGRTVLVVTHVTPVKTLVRLALGAPPEALFRMELSAAAFSAVAYYADGNASVRLFNDTSHLR